MKKIMGFQLDSAMKYSLLLLSIAIVFTTATFVNPCGPGATYHKSKYVVAGGGVAGCAAAGTISQTSCYPKVTLIEMGPDWPELTRPDLVETFNGLVELLASDPDDIYKSMLTTPQPNANNRQIEVPYAEVMGGGGSTNAGGVDFPAREFFDRINIQGWNWDRFRAFFQILLSKVESQKFPPVGLSEVQQLMYKAHQQYGYTLNNNPLGGNITGSWSLYFQAEGNVNRNRTNTYTGFIRDNPRRGQNLITKSLTRVDKIVFDNPISKKAVGVCTTDLRNGQTAYEEASRKVILALGFRTSKLLQQSGIGNETLLKSLNISATYLHPNPSVNKLVHANSKVGATYGWHNGIQTYRTVNQSYVAQPPNRDNNIIANMYAFGPASRASVGDAYWFHGVGQLTFYIQLPPEQGGGVFPYTVAIAETSYAKAKSKGTLTIASADPEDDPIVNPNLFNVAEDFTRTRDAYIELRNIMLTPSAKKAYPDATTLGGPFLPDTPQNITTIENYVRQVVGWAHDFGGNAVGNTNDQNKVVDRYLHVTGTRNLMIADLSVLPQPLGIHTQGFAGTLGIIAGCLATTNYPFLCGIY